MLPISVLPQPATSVVCRPEHRTCCFSTPIAFWGKVHCSACLKCWREILGGHGGRAADQSRRHRAGRRPARRATHGAPLCRAFGLYRFQCYWPRLFYDFHLHKQPLPDAPVEVEAISGALMLVRREAMADVGPWDEGYFLHCEDLDWCMRFQQRRLEDSVCARCTGCAS